MKNRRSQLKSKQRRDFLKVAGGAVAATAFGAFPLRGWAADPVNIGGALSDHRQLGADRPGLRQRRQARGRDGQ